MLVADTMLVAVVLLLRVFSFSFSGRSFCDVVRETAW
jgi:hypothetical protein